MIFLLLLLPSSSPIFSPAGITGEDDLTVGAITSGRVNFYPWTIDNKYYCADIHLCVVPNTFHVTAEIAEAVQAFVVYFDSTTKTGLEGVSEWLPLTEEWLPEVMILVCDRVSENGVSRQKAQEWCIKHGFELVELSPEELPDEDDDFPESTGVQRIVQALNANVWSNVVMKGVQARREGAVPVGWWGGWSWHTQPGAWQCCRSHAGHGHPGAGQPDHEGWGPGELRKALLKAERNERQSCHAAPRAEEAARREGGQSLLDGNWRRQG
nr:alpha- and gamma-adaptin-binding protein p34 isoform X2 [Zonotrichia albicollis]